MSGWAMVFWCLGVLMWAPAVGDEKVYRDERWLTEWDLLRSMSRNLDALDRWVRRSKDDVERTLRESEERGRQIRRWLGW